MIQTFAGTAKHLLPHGYVVEDSAGILVATFSLKTGGIGPLAGNKVDFIEGDDEPIGFEALENTLVHRSGTYFVFRKLAVSSGLANQKIGAALYEFAQNLGRSRGMPGMAIETVKEALWLYAWYERLGYQAIAKYRYPDSTLDIVLMLKPFPTTKEP